MLVYVVSKITGLPVSIHCLKEAEEPDLTNGGNFKILMLFVSPIDFEPSN